MRYDGPAGTPLTMSQRTDFVPLAGVEQDIVSLMEQWLEPVGADREDVQIVGLEQCATKIVNMLKEKGIDV